MGEIVKTDGVLGGKARLAGRRVSVFQIGELYVQAGDAPEVIADRLDLSLAEVHAAVAYYYDHPTETEAVGDRRDSLVTDLEERSKAPEELTR